MEHIISITKGSINTFSFDFPYTEEDSTEMRAIRRELTQIAKHLRQMGSLLPDQMGENKGRTKMSFGVIF